MKPIITPVSDSTLAKNFKNIQQCLDGGVSLDNMNILVIEGTTASVPDTEAKIAHSMTPRPVGWQMLVGDVYVQEISNKFIDVRSTKPGVNFKIILFGGAPVTGEQLVEVGSSQYLPTTEYISNNAPQITIENIVDAGITVLPVQLTASANAGPSTGTVAASSVGCLIADASYFYFTCLTGATTSVFRFNRTTGIIDSVATGAARAISALYSDGTDIWAATIGTVGTTTQIVYQFNIASFTLTATHTGTTSSATDSVNDLYVDSSNIYTNGGNTTGTSAWITKWARGGGNVTHLTLVTTTATKKARRILHTSDGLKLYVIADDTNASTTSIYEVTLSSYTVTTTYTSLGRRWNTNCGVLVNDATIYFPVSVNSTKAGTASYGVCTGLVALDLAGATFTEYPIACLTPANNANGSFITNVYYSNGYVYLITTSGDNASTAGTTLIRWDTGTALPTYFWFPWSTAGGSISANQINTVLFSDTDGLPIIYQQLGSAIGNFNYFKPDLSLF